MNKAMGIGVTERNGYALLIPLYIMIGEKTGWFDAEMAAYLATGTIAAVGSFRAWWVNRPQRLLDDAANAAPTNSKLQLVPTMNATHAEKQEIKKLGEETSQKVEAKMVA